MGQNAGFFARKGQRPIFSDGSTTMFGLAHQQWIWQLHKWTISDDAHSFVLF